MKRSYGIRFKARRKGDYTV